MPKYFSNLQFWCPDCALWHRGIILPGILHLCTFYAQEVSQSIPHRSQEAEGFIGKEEPASPSLTQWPGMWSSVSLRPDNGISPEQEDLPGNSQGIERWDLSQARVSHPTIRKARLAERTNPFIHLLGGIAAARPQWQQLFHSWELCQVAAVPLAGGTAAMSKFKMLCTLISLTDVCIWIP